MPEMDHPESKTPMPPPSSEVSPRSTRRTFTREYKMRIVREADECRETGGVGALLRREGLYSSSLQDWRREFESGGPAAPEPRRRGPKPRRSEDQKQNEKLARENARLKKRLDLAEALLDLQKKTLAMLESLHPNERSE